MAQETKPSPATQTPPDKKQEPSKREKIITETVKKLKEDLKHFSIGDQQEILADIADKVIEHKPAAGADYRRPVA